MRRTTAAISAAIFVLCAALPAAGATLADVRARGAVRCGVSVNNPGFAYIDATGKPVGFNVDFCHALAAAIFGDAGKIEATMLATRDAFAILVAGGADVLVQNLTWTFNRDNGGGVETTQVLFFDGQGFMVPKASGVTHAAGLQGATICVAQGTTTELNIADYFAANHIAYKVVSFADIDESRRAYEAGRCDAWSADSSALAARGSVMKDRAGQMILPEIISKEPIGPMVRQGDAEWSHLVKWTFFATIAAEELGLSSANVDAARTDSSNPEVKRLLGVGDDLGQKLGLSRDWAYNVIKQVGNYGEIFDRNLGPKTPIGLARGLNALWRDGGLLIAPPFR